MTEKIVTLSFVFEEVTEDGDYTYHELVRVGRDHSDLSDEDIDSYLEGLVQSDFYTIGFVNGVASAMEGREVDYTKESKY